MTERNERFQATQMISVRFSVTLRMMEAKQFSASC